MTTNTTTDATDASVVYLDRDQVEKWLDSNTQFFRDYFIRNGDLGMVNSWLSDHGYYVIREGNFTNTSADDGTGGVGGPGGVGVGALWGEVWGGPRPPTLFLCPQTVMSPNENRLSASSASSSRRASGASSGGGGGGGGTSGSLSPSSPSYYDKLHEFNAAAAAGGAGGLNEENGTFPSHSFAFASSCSPSSRSSNSKRSLRSDFARAKSKSVYQTQDGGSVGGGGGGAGVSPSSGAAASRRSSLKEMRKYTSLPPNSINILSLLIESKVKLPRYASKNLEFKRELRLLDERAFFLDVVKDIANDLDLKSLTTKITENCAVLLDAESASLFLVEGPKGKQNLVSKDPPRSVDADRFIDRHLHYPQTHDSIICMGVRSVCGDELLAVAQVVNKNPAVNYGTFSQDDEKLLETYLQFVSIALTNAQIMAATRREYERNQNLLEVVHDLFEEQTSLEKVILKIMQRAQRLLKCEKAAVLLLDENSSQDFVFSKLFELNSPINGHHKQDGGGGGAGVGGVGDESPPAASFLSTLKPGEGGAKISCNLLKLAEQVAGTGEVINIAEMVEVEAGSNGNLRSLLAMPIRNRHSEIIGVATIVNKINNLPFNEADEALFEAFTIFCGLGINNTLMYGELEVAIAKQKVAIEVLSYHATASVREMEVLMGCEVPSADEWKLSSLSFDDFSLARDQMVIAALRMFIDLGLVSHFKIDYGMLCRWLLTVQRNYRDVPYHNWRHAFNVAQVMFAILTSCEMKGTFNEIEIFAMFVACLCHDLDHRGTNNSFQAKTGSALSLVYGTQNTMEQHHFNHAVMIMNTEGHNIFSTLSSEHYSKVMLVLKECILATDLTVYFQRRPLFFDLVERTRPGTEKMSWEREEERLVLRSMLMTASDLAACTKPWTVQKRVAQLVTAEFFAQGDQERKQLQITPPASMDREREHELPQLQIRWVNDICLPLYKSLAAMNPRFGVMEEGARKNMEQWSTCVNNNPGDNGDSEADAK